jgi:hypothetical protein
VFESRLSPSILISRSAPTQTQTCPFTTLQTGSPVRKETTPNTPIVLHSPIFCPRSMSSLSRNAPGTVYNQQNCRTIYNGPINGPVIVSVNGTANFSFTTATGRAEAEQEQSPLGESCQRFCARIAWIRSCSPQVFARRRYPGPRRGGRSKVVTSLIPAASRPEA